MGWLLLPTLLDRMLKDAIPVMVPVVLLTLCGVLLGWRIHVNEYNRSATGPGSSSRFLHKIHLWQPFSYSPQPRYCNGCRQLISGFLLFRNMGYECQCCGLHSHLSCLLVCERSSCKAPGRLSHQFREGNLENTAVCALCGVICSSSFSLYGLECLWCRKAFHASCLERSKEARQPIAIHCDLGPLAHLVVPPSALELKVTHASRKISSEALNNTSVALPQSPLNTSVSLQKNVIAAAASTSNDDDSNVAPLRPASTANVDVELKPVKRVALSARKANDWQLLNFPDTTDLKALHDFYLYALSYVEPPESTHSHPHDDSSDLAASAAQVDPSPQGTNGGTVVIARKPTANQPMKLLRSLVKSKDDSAPAPFAESARTWAENVCQLFPAVSDMLMLLERSGVCPFIVFVNPKSGGQLGSLILKESYAYLNPWQVVDMSIEKNPVDALTRFQGVAMTGRLRALACGGDGSVSWVINSIHTKFEPVPSYATLTRLFQCARTLLNEPSGNNNATNAFLASLKEIVWDAAKVPVAVLPLGTGNDLAKVLNWGANFSSYLDYLPFMRKLIFARTVPIDVWNVEVYKVRKNTSASASEDEGTKASTAAAAAAAGTTTNLTTNQTPLVKKAFTNYVDLGIAARIALKFHTLREAHPELFRSRLGNKFLYGEVGVRDYLVDQSINFQDIVIYCDDEKVDLARVMNQGGLEGLAIVNIPSFGGGVEPWKGVHGHGKKHAHRNQMKIASTVIPEGCYEEPPDDPISLSVGCNIDNNGQNSSTEAISAPTLQHSSSLPSFTDDDQSVDQQLSSSMRYKRFKPQRMADGKLELIGFRSLLHLGRVQVGMADAVKIAQGKSFTILVKNKVPYQVDGEPSTIAQAEIRIRWKCRAQVLALKEHYTGKARFRPPEDVEMLHELRSVHVSLDDIKKALEKANDAGEIDSEQLCNLLRRFRYLSHPQLASF